LAIAILAANWNAKSRDDQPVSKLDRANRKECPTNPRGRQVLDLMFET
jgi:hypothetical protein